MTTYVTGGPSRYRHQRRGLQKMIATGGVTALLFDAGTGKTAVVIDYAGLLALKAPFGEARVLVVCPLVAVDTWVLQMQKFASPQVGFWAEALGGSLLERAQALASRGGNAYTATRGRTRGRMVGPRAFHVERSLALEWRHAEGQPNRPMSATQGPDGVLGPRIVLEVINIDTLAQRSRLPNRKTQTYADLMLDAINRFKPDLVVLDESHRIKSATSNASRLLARISHRVPRRMILTGTVMPHSPLDIFGQWRFLDPYAFGEKLPDGTVKQMVFGEFKDRFARYGGWMGKQVTGYQNLDHMQEVMSRRAVVARKRDCLDLPPTTDVVLPVHLSPRESLAYQEMKKELAVQLAGGQQSTVTSRLTQMLRLRQITSGHLPNDAGQVEVIGDSKARVIKSLVEDTLTSETRIVIFALFVHEIDMLAKLLDVEGTVVQVIKGDTTNEERIAMRQRFGSDDPQRLVMIAQIRTMSLAVNELVTAHHAIFASLSQQRDDLVQAQARLDRSGQQNPVTFWYAVAPGTVDEVILTSHKKRTSLEAAMLKHVQELT